MQMLTNRTDESNSIQLVPLNPNAEKSAKEFYEEIGITLHFDDPTEEPAPNITQPTASPPPPESKHEVTPQTPQQKTPENVVFILLQDMNEQTKTNPKASETNKYTQQTYFNDVICKLTLPQIKFLCQHMYDVQLGKTENKFFKLIRHERLFGPLASGNTLTWRQMFHMAKWHLIDKIGPANDYFVTELNRAEYDKYKKLLSLHAGRWHEQFGETASIKEFEKYYEAVDNLEPGKRRRGRAILPARSMEPLCLEPDEDKSIQKRF
jgi:hypothetical protein